MKRRFGLTLTILVLVVAAALAGNLVAGNHPALGLDLQGGVSVTQEPVGDFNVESLDLAVERIRERVDSLGVAEPEIIRQGNAIVVNLPGVKNQDDAIKLVQVTGAVLLRPVLQAGAIDPNATTTSVDPNAPTTSLDPNAPSTTLEPATTTSTVESTSTSAPGGPARSIPRSATTAPVTTIASTVASTTIAGGDASTTVPGSDTTTVDSIVDGATTTVATDALGAGAPSDSIATDTASPTDAGLGDPSDPTATVIVQNHDGTEVYQLGPAYATGEVFNNDAAADIINGGWGVRVTLKDGATGSDLWNVGAADCYAKTSTCPTGRMAIVLDGVVQSAPTVNQPTFTGGVDITGSFSEGEAKDLARVLKSGSLPVRLEVQAVQTVSPTLGKDSLRAAVIAGLIGVLLVLLFMIAYYRTLALIVVFGLVLSGAVQWSVISILSATNGLALSLAGIAGIIVSIGVTVDSYVVFFEKLKDEVKAGRTVRNSAERGFRSAWRTIIAADTVSLLGAFTLWYLTVGSVRGFAFFLGLSTLCDVLIAWFYTRPAMLSLARSGRFDKGHVLGVDTAASVAGGAA